MGLSERIAAMAVTAALALPGAAAADSLAFELGVAEAHDTVGWEAGFGGALEFGALRITGLGGGLFFPDPDDRYAYDYTVSRCRDSVTGYFAHSSLCNQYGVVAYGKIEATITADRIEVGVGYRASEVSETGYGIVGYRMRDTLTWRLSGGEEFVSFGILGTF